MKEPDQHRITRLLLGVNEGDEGAQKELIDLIYLELRWMARRIIFKEGRADPIFQTTELVHEAYMKLFDNNNQNWKNRKYFFGAAAQAMRQVLCTIARRIKAPKHGGQNQRVPLEEWIIKYEEEVGKLSDINGAIERLYEEDRNWGQVVDLHFFGGLTLEEIAEILNVSLSTVERRLRIAKAFLERELKGYNLDDRKERDDNK